MSDDKKIKHISYSFGMVDLLHYGHIRAIKKASEASDLTIFGVVSDDASNAWFGSHVSNENERRAVIESIRFIDEVWPQQTFDPLDNLRLLHAKYPNAIISLYTGNEWGVISSKRYIESIGGKVVKLNYYDKLSPQSILDKLNQNELGKCELDNKVISTKANTLQSLKGKITKAIIEDIFVVTVDEFRNNPCSVSEEVYRYFSEGKIVVRSSSKREDAFEESNAGHFVSVLDIDVADVKSISRAINAVVLSYGADVDGEEQVLIQRQTENVLVSGVVFTRDIRKNRPYYVINYDVSGKTDAVTSGSGGTTVWLAHSVSKKDVPVKWLNLMEAVWELENILQGILLDIEFAITSCSVVIFQVRPLAAAYKFGRDRINTQVEDARDEVYNKYKEYHQEGLTCFSDMAFWNPAEIIGDNPKNLDFSLYREIITKSAWSEGLLPMGYRSVPKELMFRFGNKPYINVERSFEALIPATLSDSLASKVRCYYVEKLKKDLSAHDKIEFEISCNCFDFSLHKRIASMLDDGFSREETLELEQALVAMTIKIINEYPNTLKRDQEDLRKLESIRIDVQNMSEKCNDFKMLSKYIRVMLDAINIYGTPQFARQARCAFIANSLLKSLVKEEHISIAQYNGFISSIHTIAIDYDRDYHAVLDGRVSWDEFRQKYGHLRAGTYNIRSPRYDQMEDLLEYKRACDEERATESNSDIDSELVCAVNRALEVSQVMGLLGENTVEFIKLAIEQREYFKYIFTKSLSFAIELIKKMGIIVGINIHSLSYLELPEIYAAEYYTDINRLKEFWTLIIEKRHGMYDVYSELILPPVICTEQDINYIEYIETRPNFVTENQVTGYVVMLDRQNKESLDGKIVVIEKADPGYDWIFSRGIVGLITKYGGAASHMAIRCAEFKLPAVIGCGINIYDYVSESKRITIDCKNEKIVRVE